MPQCRRASRRRRPERPGARGFLLLTVMVLLFVVTLMVGWGIRRATMQSRIAEFRIEDYRLHHERLGLIAIAERWMRQEDPESLEAHAVSPERAYWATLPNDAELQIGVADGQGLLSGRTEASTGEIHEAMVDALTRIPPGRNDLIRDVGPPSVSLRAAPDEVLLALAAGDERVAEMLEDLRRDLPKDDNALRIELNRGDLDVALANRLSTLLTVEPTLWRLDAEVTDEHGTRRYQILIEFRGNRVLTHSCRMLPPTDENDRRRRDRGRR